MSSQPSSRLRGAVAIALAGAGAVVVGGTAATPIAAGVRALFRAVTPDVFLVLLGAAFAASVGAALAPSLSITRFGPSPARSRSSLADRVGWPAAVGIAAAVAGVVWYSLGRGTVVPRIFGDELTHGEAARNLALHGSFTSRGYGLVTPALDSLAYLVTANDVTAYHLVQTLNVVVMVTAAFVAYPLARRVLSARWALSVAALTLAVPWFTYARFALTEADFYPVFLLFALALVRALEHPTWRRQLLVLAAVGLAYLTRTQAVVFAGAIVVAAPLFGLAQGRLRETLRAFAPTWALYAAGAVLVVAAAATGVWSPLGPYRHVLDGWRHPHGLAIWAAANLSALFLGLGVLVGLAAVLGVAMLLRRASSPAAAALAAVSVAGTAALLSSVTLLSESPFGQGSVHERDLFFAAPLLISCALAWATNGCPRPRLLTAVAAALVIGLAALIPAGALDSHLIDALSFKVWAQLDVASLSPSAWAVTATAAGALVVLTMRSPWPLVLTVALAAVGVAAASDYRSAETHAEAARYGWVDRALPAGAKITVLYIGYSRAACPPNAAPSPLPAMSVLTEYFNAGVTRVGHLLDDNSFRGVASTPFRLRSDGVVTSGGRPLRPGYVVTDARLALAGARLAELPSKAVAPEPRAGPGALALWRVPGPLRLLRPAQVLHPRRLAGC